MAIYLVRGSEQKIKDIILSFIKQEGLELDDSRFLSSQDQGNDNIPLFSASTPFVSEKKSRYYFEWHSSPIEFYSKVEMKVKLGKKGKAAISWSLILGMFFLVLLFLFAFKGPGSVTGRSEKILLSFIVLFTGLFSLAFLLNFIYGLYWHGHKISDFENNFLTILNNELLTEKISYGNVLSKTHHTIMALMVAAIFYILLHIFGFKLLAFLVTVFLMKFIVSWFIRLFAREDFNSKWKHAMVTLDDMWSCWQCGILFLIVILISCKPILHLHVQLIQNLAFILILGILGAFNVLPFVLINFVTKWHQLLGKNQEVFPRPPSITSITTREDLIGKLLVLAQIPFSLVLHWFAMLVSIDAFYYLKENDIIFFNFSEQAFNLVLYVSFNSKVIAGIILFVLALPSIIVLLSMFTYMIVSMKECVRLITIPEYSSIPNQVKNFIKETADFLKVSVPRVLVDEKTEIPIKSSLIFPFSSRPAIIINARILKELSNEELQTVIAHEFYHIKYNLYPLFIANLASWLCLFPNNYFTLYFDFVKMEFEADRFAMDITKNRTYLISALIKNNEAGFINDSVKQLSSINKLKIFMQFYFGNALLGYVYPRPIERLNEINRYAFNQSD
ncbi:MAG: M48 family metalloprotease [Syntrophorhabdaceae bacterium]|nr:M48 family metalloprotease [Syntrophorhabdaceae bacterium]MDD5551460.1 M48 family metalloprotease [Candidatus Omnitrophota bacterium]